MTSKRPVQHARMLAASVCVALGLGGWIAFRSETPKASVPGERAAAPAREKTTRRQPLPRELINSTQRSTRLVGDTDGPEYTEHSARALSVSVRPEERAALEAAWRSGNFAHAAAVASALPEPRDRRQVLLPLVAEWAAAAPADAARFAQVLPAGVERRELLETAVRAWAERDVAAASAWLNALEPHADQDGAVAAIALCPVLLVRRPEIASSWAESIEAPAPRWETLCAVATAWARSDAAAARRYVEGCAALTPDERARVLAHLGAMIAAVE